LSASALVQRVYVRPDKRGTRVQERG